MNYDDWVDEKTLKKWASEDLKTPDGEIASALSRQLLEVLDVLRDVWWNSWDTPSEVEERVRNVLEAFGDDA